MIRISHSTLGIATLATLMIPLAVSCGASSGQPVTPAAPVATPDPGAAADPTPVPQCEPAETAERPLPDTPVYTVIVDAEVKPEFVDKIVPFSEDHNRRVRDELPGFLRSTVVPDPQNPRRFVFVSTYRGEEDWKAYFNTKAKEADFAKFGEMYSRAPIVIAGYSPYTF